MEPFVPDHLGYCFSGDRAIFLDVQRDRYFALSANLSAVFRSVVEGGLLDEDGAAIKSLVSHGVVTIGNAGSTPRREAPLPRRDLASVEPLRFNPHHAIGVGSAVLAAKVGLKRQPLSSTIDRIRRRALDANQIDLEQTERLCASFRRHRQAVPIASVCLLDSVALLNFLHARGGGANLIFGVTPSPFSAHCWCQIGDRVVNDALDRVLGRIPILVV